MGSRIVEGGGGNPKTEIRNPKEGRTPKSEIGAREERLGEEGVRWGVSLSLLRGALAIPTARRDEFHESLTSTSNRPKLGTRVTRPSGKRGYGALGNECRRELSCGIVADVMIDGYGVGPEYWVEFRKRSGMSLNAG